MNSLHRKVAHVRFIYLQNDRPQKREEKRNCYSCCFIADTEFFDQSGHFIKTLDE